MKKVIFLLLLVINTFFVISQEKELSPFEGLPFGTEKQDAINYFKQRSWKIKSNSYDRVHFKNGKIGNKSFSSNYDNLISLFFYDKGKLSECYFSVNKSDEIWCKDYIKELILKYDLKQQDPSKTEYIDSNKNRFYYYESGNYYFMEFKKFKEEEVHKQPEIEFIGGEFVPGYTLTVNISEDGEKSIGYLYPDVFEQQVGIPKCICSRIAPSYDGYVEFVMTLPSALKANEFSLFLKTGDEIVFNIKAPINNGLNTFQSKVLIKIISARPNSIKYEVVKKL